MKPAENPARNVRCPVCNAKPGAPCITAPRYNRSGLSLVSPGGLPMERHHSERVAAARECERCHRLPYSCECP